MLTPIYDHSWRNFLKEESMKTLNYFSAFLILCSGCTSMDIGSQTDKTFDFSNYKTFAWQKRSKNFKMADAKVANELVETRILRYTNEELQARGLKIDTLQPDLLIDYSIQTKEVEEQVTEPVASTPYYYSVPNPYSPYNGFYSPFYTGPIPYVYGYRTTKTTYENGTVTIYVIDRLKNKLIWKTWAEGSVEDVEAFERQLPKDIKLMFNNFPIKK